MTKPLLEVKNLRVEFPTRRGTLLALDDISFDISPGEILGVVGESGAGKSTIGLPAMGFTRDGCRISGGSVEFDGMELTTTPESDLRALRGSRIAYVAQSAAASFNPAQA